MFLPMGAGEIGYFQECRMWSFLDLLPAPAPSIIVSDPRPHDACFNRASVRNRSDMTSASGDAHNRRWSRGTDPKNNCALPDRRNSFDVTASLVTSVADLTVLLILNVDN